jgi:hypothetical protein
MPQFLLVAALLLLGSAVLMWYGPGIVRSTRTSRRTVHLLKELRRHRL